MPEKPEMKFIIGTENICKYFGFGRIFFMECLKNGAPYKKTPKGYLISIKKFEEFMEKLAE